MRKLRLWAIFLLVLALFRSVSLEAAQDPATDQPVPAPPPAKPQFFAGTVVELDLKHIKVSRTLVGRPTEVHSFIVNDATKMNKTAIKLRTRVTVRYLRRAEGDLALEIQPRPVVRSPKANPL